MQKYVAKFTYSFDLDQVDDPEARKIIQKLHTIHFVAALGKLGMRI